MKKSVLLIVLLLSQLSITYAQQLIQDLRPGMDGSDPDLRSAILFNNELYFTATPDASAARLYKKTANGGNLVLVEGSSDFFVNQMIGVMNGKLYYVAGNPFQGVPWALYATTGAPGTGQLVKEFTQDLEVLLVSYPMHIVMNNVLYFYAADENTGFELWRTDGTEAGTYMVKDINPGIESSLLMTNVDNYFARMGDYIYFGAGDPVNGAELWRSDGTEAGTTLVANIDTTEAIIAQMGSNPAYLTVHNGVLYFSAYRPVDGRELWRTDGTAAGTQLVKDISAGDSYPSTMLSWNGHLYFTAYYPDQTFTLFKSDGTTAGTQAVLPPNNGGPQLTLGYPYAVFKNKLYFATSSLDGYTHIGYSDGTAAGTGYLPNGPELFNTTPNNLLTTSNYLYFTATDDVNIGVFRTTELPNQMVRLTDPEFNANEFHHLFLMDSCIVVRGSDGTAGEELYNICGQISQPVGIVEQQLVAQSYPNPADHEVWLQYSGGTEQISAIHLTDINGNNIAVNWTPVTADKLRIDGLESLPEGCYFIHSVTTGGVTLHTRLMVTH